MKKESIIIKIITEIDKTVKGAEEMVARVAVSFEKSELPKKTN